MTVLEIIAPGGDLAGGVKATNEVLAELARIREETPRFPRWFLVRFVGPDYDPRRFSDVVARHKDPGMAEVFVWGGWVSEHVSSRWDLASTLQGVERGIAREITRAEAYARTAGNP